MRSVALSRGSVLLAMLGALVLAHAAGASRAPTSSEKTAIARAAQSFFTGWYYGSTSPIRVRVSHVRISTADPNWASASVSGPAAKGRPALAGPGSILLWHAPGGPGERAGALTRSWVVVSPRYTGEYAWCGIAPTRVTVDLGANYGC